MVTTAAKSIKAIDLRKYRLSLKDVLWPVIKTGRMLLPADVELYILSSSGKDAEGFGHVLGYVPKDDGILQIWNPDHDLPYLIRLGSKQVHYRPLGMVFAPATSGTRITIYSDRWYGAR